MNLFNLFNVCMYVYSIGIVCNLEYRVFSTVCLHSQSRVNRTIGSKSPSSDSKARPSLVAQI